MEQTIRSLLLLVLAAGALTGAAGVGAWWFETGRRLRRILRKVLQRAPEAEAIDAVQGRAAGLDLEGGGVAVLWDRGGSGLVYAIDELDSAELIIDGHVSARVGRGDRRNLDAMPANAEQVTLRLLFNDARWPEFELELWGPAQVASAGSRSPGDAIRLGRRWLAHVDALLRRPRTPPTPPAPDDLPS